MAIGFPTPDSLKKILDIVYDFDEYSLFVSPDKDRTGLIGIDTTMTSHGWLLHLAVHPDCRKKGVGRSLIRQLEQLLSLESLSLETDQDAVGFYRACGFTAAEIHNKWPGVHRFRCIKGNPPESVLEYYNNKILPDY